MPSKVRGAAYFSLHDLTLAIREVEPANPALFKSLEALSFVRAQIPEEKPTIVLAVDPKGQRLTIPADAREAFRADGFSQLETAGVIYLTDGRTTLKVQPQQSMAQVWLDRSFLDKPASLQYLFWAYGLLKLLRGKEVFNLHAAGLVSPAGEGLLLVGQSGSGKSTLSIGLIRAGWGYLSDDTLLLRRQGEFIEALALRKHFYVDHDASAAYLDLALGEPVADTKGGQRRCVDIHTPFADHYRPCCIPQRLLFTKIVPREVSVLRTIRPALALARLLEESGSQLFDRDTMDAQIGMLNQLIKQTRIYQLEAGRDLYQAPTRLMALLAQAEGGDNGPHHH